jgi:ribosomal protein S18 acetylase RimI-like enzyme
MPDNFFVIEVMQLTDYDELVAFWTGKEGVELNESDEREAIGRYLERNKNLSLVVRDQGRIVGAILSGNDGRRGYLHHLAVDEAYRGKGIGRALVERCLSDLKAIGVPRCNVFYMADNPKGKAFWERLGYRPVKFLPLQRPT